jgi:hypothetical protein
MVSVNRISHQCGARSGCGRSERSHRSRPRRPVPRSDRVFFSFRGTQHVKTSVIADWVAAGAMLLAAASWGLVVMLLGS